MLGPLAHASWGEKAGSHHVFPLYYRDKERETFVSLPVVSWKNGAKRNWVYPPLLSSYATKGETRELKLLLGLCSETWDKKSSEGYFVPFYAHGKDYLYTPVAGWKNDAADGFVYPFTPLAGFRTGDYSGGWLFPLFSYAKEKKTGNYDGTFLVGRFWRNKEECGSWMFPLYRYSNRPMPEQAPDGKVASGHYGKSFWSIPMAWYKDETWISSARASAGNKPEKQARQHTKRHGFFPLWSYSSRMEDPEGNLAANGTFLLGIGYYFNYALNQLPRTDEQRESKHHRLLGVLYAYEKNVNPAAKHGEPKRSESSSVLWRLWHHKTDDGLETLDMPGIAYTRKPDGFRKFSVLWKLFSYEKSSEGCKVDALFVIPLWRSSGERNDRVKSN
jgi:hypothetical protein